MSKKEYIEIRGADAHNLKGVNVDIPRGEFVVVTGLSGSGKSSLAFDTIYAEGQRRYMDTLSTYAKHFMGVLEKPEVESITGLSPIIAIEQKTTGNNPRSTVGTITEIFDFLRLLYARASRAYSPVTGKEMTRYTDAHIIDLIMNEYRGKKCYLLAPLVVGRKGHYRELFDQMRKRGYTDIRVDGKILPLNEVDALDRYKSHFIELVVDKLNALHAGKLVPYQLLQRFLQLRVPVIPQRIRKAHHRGFAHANYAPHLRCGYKRRSVVVFRYVCRKLLLPLAQRFIVFVQPYKQVAAFGLFRILTHLFAPAFL